MIGIDATAVRLRDLNLRTLERFVYEYDFGDSWIHDLRVETTLPINPRKILPDLCRGECSAPPEDCGGPPGFTWSEGILSLLGSKSVNLASMADRLVSRAAVRH